MVERDGHWWWGMRHNVALVKGGPGLLSDREIIRCLLNRIKKKISVKNNTEEVDDELLKTVAIYERIASQWIGAGGNVTKADIPGLVRDAQHCLNSPVLTKEQKQSNA